MKTTNILYTIILILSIALASSLAIGLQNGSFSLGHVSPKVSVNMEYHFEIAEGAGVKDISGSSGNLITDIGDQFISNLTVGRTMTSFTYGTNGTVYIALGNGTNLAYADTKLTTECALADTGFKRSAALTPTYASGTGIGNGNHYNFTITNKFTATQADTINCTSVQWSSVPVSDNNMFNEASIGTLPTGQAFAIGDNCTITVTITFQH